MNPIQDKSNTLGSQADRILARKLATRLADDVLDVMRNAPHTTSTLLSTGRDDSEDE
jgi:hypothetical protein